MRVTYCPFCHGRHDSVASVETKKRPGDGDCTLCFTCGEWAFFDKHAKGGLRKPTWIEYQDLVSIELFAKIRAAWVEMNDERQSGG